MPWLAKATTVHETGREDESSRVATPAEDADEERMDRWDCWFAKIPATFKFPPHNGAAKRPKDTACAKLASSLMSGN